MDLEMDISPFLPVIMYEWPDTLYIRNIRNRDRRNMLNKVHTEYFYKLARFVEKKIDEIEMEIEENVLSEYGIRDLEKDQKQWEWSYILDDIFYNSNKVVNSQYRPDRHYAKYK